MGRSQLLMVREQLEDLPVLRIQDEGYAIRHFQAGDGAHWERIVEAAFGMRFDFAKEIAAHAVYAPERVWFACDANGVPVATATAWHKPEWAADTGYLHMVGLEPAHAGKRLGYRVSLAALLHMRGEGRQRAVLHTDDDRLPAIKTYLNLAFKPMLADRDHYDRWQELAGVFGRQIAALNEGGEPVLIG